MLYSAAAAASGGMSLSDRMTTVRPARSSLADQAKSAGTGPRLVGCLPSTATEHKKYCCSSSTNSQNALRSKPRNLTSCINALSIAATTRSAGTFAKRTESSKSRRSNSRSSSSDGFDSAAGWRLLHVTLTDFRRTSSRVFGALRRRLFCHGQIALQLLQRRIAKNSA